MKVVTVLGARPQFVKAGTVSREIKRRKQSGEEITEVIVHTGQHYDSNMSDVFFTEMQIPKPDYNLGVGGKSHAAMTGQMMEKIESILMEEKPDWLMVYGDTNSTIAGALVAAKINIRIAHIEAGLRSFNMKMPEEINRILTDRISSLLFCPTQTAIDNLNNEGIGYWGSESILSGDVMMDGALFYKNYMVKPAVELDNDFILCTIHRPENTDDIERLTLIVEALNTLSNEIQICIPLHPRTKKKLQDLNVQLSDKVVIINPVGYLNMVWLINHCKAVFTDSGGLQKESFFFAKPCVVLRDQTEWIELVENGFNQLVGADKEAILSAYSSINYSADYELKLYGEGDASKLIIDALLVK
jgi:UDP-GlcNAc3NAcA epimerase